MLKRVRRWLLSYECPVWLRLAGGPTVFVTTVTLDKAAGPFYARAWMALVLIALLILALALRKPVGVEDCGECEEPKVPEE